MEKKDEKKKVSFETGSNEEVKNKVKIIRLKEEIDRELEKAKEGWERKMKGIEERLSKLEEELKEIKGLIEEKVFEKEDKGDSDREKSGVSSRWGSEWSVMSGKSSGFSEKEVGRLKDMMEERERYEKRNNIVIKGIDIEEKDKIDEKWIEKFIMEVIEIKAKVLRCRISSRVIVATIENSEKKAKIMKRKGRLGERKIYIENNLMGRKEKAGENFYMG